MMSYVILLFCPQGWQSWAVSQAPAVSQQLCTTAGYSLLALAMEDWFRSSQRVGWWIMMNLRNGNVENHQFFEFQWFSTMFSFHHLVSFHGSSQVEVVPITAAGTRPLPMRTAARSAPRLLKTFSRPGCRFHTRAVRGSHRESPKHEVTSWCTRNRGW